MTTHEVVTLLRVRDEATAVLQRYSATLREIQVQIDTTLASFKKFRNALAPTSAALSRQREALDLAGREAQIRAGIGAEQVKASEAMLAARRESLAITQSELAAQRGIASALVATEAAKRNPSWRGAANRVGNDLMWGGVGILGVAAYATQKAIDFNQTALETDVALGGYARTPAQRATDMRALQRAAMAGSEATGFFSAQEILQGLKVAASSGARPLVDKMGMDVFTKIAPSLAQYMDIVGRLKGESADAAAMEAIRSAHMFGAYTPDAIRKTLDAQAALSLLMPDKMSRALNVMAYAVPSGTNLAGVPMADILSFVATADQSGLGSGRAGARLKDYIEAISVRQSKAREAAKRELGMSGALDAHGNLDLMKSFEILQSDAKRMSAQAYRNLVRTAFGSPGAIVAAMFGDEKKRAMFDANRDVISKAVQRGDLKTVQDVLKGGPAGKEATMLAELNNDMIDFGRYGLPIAIKFFDAINPKVKEFGNWLDAHPRDAAKLFDDLVHAGEGLLIFGGALKALAIVSSTVGALRTLYTAVSGVRAAAASAAPAVGTVAGALRGLAGAGAAFLASPLGKIFSGAAVFFGTTSFMPQDNARRDLINRYGYDYWRYLKARHPGTNPYSFDRGSGDLTPQQFRASSHKTDIHVSKVEINLPNVKDGPAAASAIADLFRDPRHMLATSGRIRTHPNVPAPITSAFD